MPAPRRLLGALACATALLAPAAAEAAPTGVNVSHLSNNGDPYVAAPGNLPGDASDTARTWQDLTESGAKLVRSFAHWTTLRGPTRQIELDKFRQFTDKANARGMKVLLTLTGDRTSVATPAEYAAVAGDLARELRGKDVAYEVWNEQDDTTFWANGPQPAAYAALLRAAYPAFKAADANAKVIVGGLVGNDYEFVEAIYDHGAKGSFDGVGVHTDTACLTTDPREYYREPNGRIGRYSFTGYREVRATMLAHGDDKPVWMTELGWSTTSATCERGGRAGTKEGGVSQAVQADFLSKAYGCLANDPWVEQAAWFNLHDLDTGASDDSLNLGLVTDSFVRKPAFNAFQGAVAATPIACGGVLDSGVPQVRFVAPTDGSQYLTSLPIHVTATDDQGVNDIDVIVDGKEVPLKTVKRGTGASVKFEWGGAKELSYGPHTIVATARDEAKNEGKAIARVTHVGGGAYPFKVKTTLAIKLGKVRKGKVSVRGKVTPRGDLAPRALGSVQVKFSRFDTREKRWKRFSLYRKDAKRAFRFTHRFKKRGVWRVTGKFVPKKGFSGSASKPRKLRVR
ncbi:MAG: Ig-like domain-containing protein [Solirubrobacteraceae bacterium]